MGLFKKLVQSEKSEEKLQCWGENESWGWEGRKGEEVLKMLLPLKLFFCYLLLKYMELFCINLNCFFVSL